MAKLPEDKKLYQYRAIDTAQQLSWLIKLMETGEIFCNSIKNFNDPFDSQSIMGIPFDEVDDFLDEYFTPDVIQKVKNLPVPTETKAIRGEYFYNGYLKSAFEELAKNLNGCEESSEYFELPGLSLEDISRTNTIKKYRALLRLNERINEMFQIGGVACFTENPENLTMWSHYANNHSGVCVEFDLVELTDKQKERMANRLYKVKYVKELPDACRTVLEGLKKGKRISAGRLIQDSRKNKLKSWSYEEEWRLALPRISTPKIYFNYGIDVQPKDFDIVLDYNNTLPYDEIRYWQRQGKSILVNGFLNPDIISSEEERNLDRFQYYATPTRLGEIPGFLTEPFSTEFVKPSKIILGYNMDADIKSWLYKIGDELGIQVRHMKLEANGLVEYVSNKR